MNLKTKHYHKSNFLQQNKPFLNRKNKHSKAVLLCGQGKTSDVFARRYNMDGRINNHLKNKYSSYVFSFIKKYHKELSIHDDKILDVGCGHARNLKLFEELGFKKLYGFDINKTDNPLHVNFEWTRGDVQEGLPYQDKSFDIVLCNYVLMFIAPDKLNFVIDELLRVTNKFLIIETYRYLNNSKNTMYQDYSFQSIVEYIKNKSDFELLQVRNYYEKLLVKRR